MKIGVALPMAEGKEPIASYAEIRAFAQQAEAAGFDSIWVYDHLLMERGAGDRRGIWEAWTLLTALAEATRRVELGTLVLCTAFRNPAILAKMANDLDAISGGRLILGLGAGWHQPEFDAFGIPFDHKVDRFEEALAIILPLLREGRVDFAGSYYRAPNCELRPPPARPGGPPILIGAGKPRMLRLTARHADLWNTCWLGDAAELEAPRADLEAACAEVGRDPATLGVTVGVGISYPPDSPVPPGRGALSGSVDAVAVGLRAYAERGVAHLIFAFLPTSNQEALAWLSEALERYRSQNL
jgi:probable F420-dependent oxidoreductase